MALHKYLRQQAMLITAREILISVLTKRGGGQYNNNGVPGLTLILVLVATWDRGREVARGRHNKHSINES